MSADRTDTVLAGLADAVWRRARNDACPQEMIPDEEALIAWWENCPETALTEANRRLTQTLGEESNWELGPGFLAATSPILAGPVYYGYLVINEVHVWWERITKQKRPKHPFAPIVAAWQARPKPAKPFRPVHRASLPKLHRLSPEDGARMRLIGGGPERGPPTDREPAWLPGLEPAVRGCPSWLLWAYDRAGGPLMRQGRGAPWELRLLIGSLLHLAVDQRDGEWRTLRLKTREVERWLHPHGWSNRRRDWEKLPEALARMRERLSWMPVRGVGLVAMAVPTVIPDRRDDPLIEFSVRVPRSAANGARIDWPQLCAYGANSAVIYRAYLAATALLDVSARRGHPQTAEIPLKQQRADGDKEALAPNPTARFAPKLTNADLARMIGFDATNKLHRARAREAFERLAADEVIDLQRETPTEWRVLGVRKEREEPAETPKTDGVSS